MSTHEWTVPENHSYGDGKVIVHRSEGSGDVTLDIKRENLDWRSNNIPVDVAEAIALDMLEQVRLIREQANKPVTVTIRSTQGQVNEVREALNNLGFVQIKEA
jgi:hypothetical protein